LLLKLLLLLLPLSHSCCLLLLHLGSLLLQYKQLLCVSPSRLTSRSHSPCCSSET
jgi:hypothetical protein